MPRDVSWRQELVLAVGQETATSDIENVRVLGVYVGKVAPEFAGTTLDGKPFKLSDLRGKLVLVDFWATWCAPCVAELSGIQKAYQDYAAAGFEVVSISFDRDAAIALRFVTDKNLMWTHLWAERGDKGPLAEQYGVGAIPATFLIGPDGKVIGRDLRGDALREAIDRALRKRG